MPGKAAWRQQLKSFFSWGYRFTPPIAPVVMVELPLTPAHIVVLRHHVRAERQWFLGATAAATTFALLLSVHAFGVRPTMFGLLIAIAGCFAGFGFLMDWLGWRRGHDAEIRKGDYFRASGQIRVFLGSSTGSVQVGDMTIKHVSNAICARLRELPFGYVDYAPRTRFVVEQRDADGELLYRHPGYRPDADTFDERPMPNVLVGILCGIGSCTVLMVALFALVIWIAGQR